MNRIHLLTEQVANQIAAGEVVERPASVVKELVENALDAGARLVTLEIHAGGRSLIRVSDDGYGMSRDDALLCLERHATSKIRVAEDLAAVTTMGFRGEALPSIASVSRFSITTRERDNPSPEGTQVIVNGGRIVDVKAAGCAGGTIIEARQLFFNLPARRKFLRSEQTESAHIQHYFTLAALAFPEVAFTFIKDARLVWQLPAVLSGGDIPSKLEALRTRMNGLYGAELKMLPLNFSATLMQAGGHGSDEDSSIPEPDPAFRLWGFIGAPGISRSTREDQHLFVNRRPIENRGLNFALMEGYHTALMKGRYPVACLFLELDPAAVDVNIHPAKREVKFHREMDVRRLVTQAVRQVILRFATTSRQPDIGEEARSSPMVEQGESPDTNTLAHSEIAPDESARSAVLAASTTPSSQTILPGFPTPPPSRAEILSTTALQQALRMGFAQTKDATGPQEGAAPAGAAPPPSTDDQSVTHSIASQSGTAQAAAGAPSAQPRPFIAPEHQRLQQAQKTSSQPATGPVPFLAIPLRLIGVVGRLYVLLESDQGLVLLDQHAAHERVLFEQMLARLERHEQAPSQKLLLPETVELSARDAAFARDNLPVLARLGVGLSEFGDRTFLLDSLPPFVKAAAPRHFVVELIDQLKAAGQEVNTVRLGELVVARTVCRHAVKANDPLAGEELEKLIADLRQCAMPYTCPHGRPTMIEIKYRELEKKFGRAQ